MGIVLCEVVEDGRVLRGRNKEEDLWKGINYAAQWSQKATSTTNITLTSETRSQDPVQDMVEYRHVSNRHERFRRDVEPFIQWIETRQGCKRNLGASLRCSSSSEGKQRYSLFSIPNENDGGEGRTVEGPCVQCHGHCRSSNSAIDMKRPNSSSFSNANVTRRVSSLTYSMLTIRHANRLGH